jgi:hypothetical protein
MRYSVYFPGGSGRIALICQIYDLTTGEEVDLLKLFKSSGLEAIRAYAAKNNLPMKSPYEPEGLLPENRKEYGKSKSPFCLEQKGLLVLKSMDGKFFDPDTQVYLTSALMEQVFTPSPVIDELKK